MIKNKIYKSKIIFRTYLDLLTIKLFSVILKLNWMNVHSVWENFILEVVMIKKDKKNIVLESTLELIAERGVYSTSMSQIAKHSNIAVGTIYLYFPNKEDLINSLYITVKTKLANYVFERYIEDKSIEESFFSLFKNIIDYL